MLEIFGQYTDIVISVGIFLFSLLLAFAVRRGLKVYLSKLTAKTDTVLDDIMLRNLSRPIYFAIILAGLLAASQSLKILSEYANILHAGFIILFTILGAFIVVRILNGLLEWYAIEVAKKVHAEVDKHYLSTIHKAIYIVVFAVALLWMCGQLGIEITTLIATLGIGGLAVALALQPTLSNFFSGAYVIMDKPIKIGDYIELDTGERGYVENIGWRSTRIRVFGDNYLIIPNSKLAEAKIINYCQPMKETTFSVECGVAYGSDLEKVEKVVIDVAKKVLKKVPGGVPDYEPVVRFYEFGDSNINFKVLLRAKTPVDKYLLTHEFIKALDKRFKKEKIEISWPVRKVYMAK